LGSLDAPSFAPAPWLLVEFSVAAQPMEMVPRSHFGHGLRCQGFDALVHQGRLQ
jgi:hypothetical protein